MSPANDAVAGTLVIHAPPLQLAYGVRLSAATLSWTCSGTDAVEVHVGAPDGPLFCRGGAQGSETTGVWVHDGMVFFLQDVSGGKAPSATYTVATAAARLDARYGHIALRDTIPAIVQQHLETVVHDVTLVATHHDSVVYKVDCGLRSIFFKAFLSERDDTVALEAWAYARVRQLGVPAPDVLVLDTSRRVFPASYVLLSQVRGMLLRDYCAPMTEVGKSLLRETGRYLRQIHSVDLDAFGNIDPHVYVRRDVIRGMHATWLDAVRQKFTLDLQRLDALRCVDGAVLSGAVTAFEDQIAVLGERGRCNALLHGDFDLAQVFVDQDGATLTGFLDFDDVASGDPAWDLASLAHSDGDDMLQILLEGYEPDAALRRCLPARLSLYGLIHDVVDARVFHQRGWREQAGRAAARLSERARRSG